MHETATSMSGRGVPGGGPPDSVLIVGAGVAGFSAAAELRRLGHRGSIDLVDLQGAPYDRPPLSKQYLTGEFDLDRLRLAPPDWYDAQRVTLRHATVTELDPGTHTVVLDDGTVLHPDAVILATGGRPLRLGIPGADLPGIVHLREIADADRLREALAPGTSLAIIGGGLIGAEVAASAAARGVEVTLVDPVEVPLATALGDELARHVHGWHREHGVAVEVAAATRIDERSGGGVDIALDSGDRLTADTVLVAVGLAPDVELAERAGLEVDGAILVDEGQRTSHPWVQAIGDAARPRQGEDRPAGRRQEHWEHAERSGQAAAAAVLGEQLPDHGAPWFWSDRYGHHVEVVGSLTGPGEVLVRWVEGRPVMAFRIQQDTLHGFACVDGGLSAKAARRIIDGQIPVRTEDLIDPDLPLKKLARPPRR